MPVVLFPHHHWADADGLSAPDPQLAATDYFRKDPDTYSRNLQRWHQRLWSRTLADGTGLELTLERKPPRPSLSSRHRRARTLRGVSGSTALGRLVP